MVSPLISFYFHDIKKYIFPVKAVDFNGNCILCYADTSYRRGPFRDNR
jgi:hypothetical protein